MKENISIKFGFKTVGKKFFFDSFFRIKKNRTKIFQRNEKEFFSKFKKLKVKIYYILYHFIFSKKIFFIFDLFSTK